MTGHAITYAEACHDPNLFGPWFSGDTWATWRVVDKALFGLPLDDDELAVFCELTGRDEAPTAPVTEAWLIMGRRAGKDVKAASIATYIVTFGAEIYSYRKHLTRGERGVVQVLAVDRDQARVCLGYVRAFFEQPIFAKMVARDTADGLELTNSLAIEITTNDRRRVRGRTVIAAIFDEVAFWQAEYSVNPDDEVYSAVKPAMATIPGAMLIGISSPYARRGLLYRKYKTHWGKSGSVLMMKAPTWRMNPTLPRDGEFLTSMFHDDPSAADAEFGANFRTDVEAFISREAVDACVSLGVYERPFIRDVKYRAFVDPSGGSNDAMTLAISHVERDNRIVLDAIRERKPPFSPQSVVEEFAKTLTDYGINEVHGDRYGGEFPRELFRKYGVNYAISELSRSELYRELLPKLNSGVVDLLDNDIVVNHMVGLERGFVRGGR
jgi:hypothetical protein